MAEYATNIKITAEEEVSKTLDKVTKSLGGSDLGNAIQTVSVGFLAIKAAAEVAGRVFNEFVNVTKQVVQAAGVVELAEQRLAAALSLAGRSAEISNQQIQDFSSALSRTQGLAGETSIDLLSLGVSFGMSAKQAMTAANAALDYAAATGVTADQAMRQMAATMSGNIGLMGRTIPALKTLTDAQLRSGDAINLISSRYRGMANEMSGTFLGSLKIAREGFEENIEVIGNFIVKSEFARETVKAFGEMMFGLAESIRNMQQFLKENSEEIKAWGEAVIVAAAAVGIFVIALKASAIAMGIAAVATMALNLALAASPYILVAVAVAGLVYAFKNLGIGVDEVVSFFKMLIGAALTPVTVSLGVLMDGLAMLVRIFDKDLSASLSKAADKVSSFGITLATEGAVALFASEQNRNLASSIDTVGTAADQNAELLKRQQEELRRLSQEFVRLQDAVKPAFDAVKDFAPRLVLAEWKRSERDFRESLEAMRKTSKEIIVNLTARSNLSDEEKSMLEAAKVEHEKALIAILGLHLKNEQTIREIKIKESQVALHKIHQDAIAVEDDILMIRIEAAEKLRDRQIQMATQRVMKEQGIIENLVSVEEQARINAQGRGLAAYSEYLDSRMKLAVDSELQKQLALGSLEAQITQGLPAVGVDDTEVKRERERQLQLQALYDVKLQDAISQYEKGLITREQYLEREAQLEARYDTLMAESSMRATISIMEQERNLMDQRAELLGLTDAGLQARMEAVQYEYDIRLEKLISNLENQLITEEQFRASEEVEKATHLERLRAAQVDHNNQLIASNQITWQTITATRQNFFDQMSKQQNTSINDFLSGVSTMQAAQQGMSSAFSKVGAAMIQNQSMSAKKMVGVFLEAFGTQVMQKGFGDIAMSIFPPNPVMAAAGTAQVALGTVIGRMGTSMQKQGGQADEGLTRVPESLSGRSFTLTAGERVVAKNQNVELGRAIERINSGAASTSNISVTVNGNPDNEQLRALRETLMDAIRNDSERGRPVINERGVTR